MIYNSFNFIIFFPLLFILYYLIPVKVKSIRNGYLLLVSYLLYVKWNPKCALVLLCVTLVTYFAALIINKLETEHKSKYLLTACGVILTIIPLIIFKYTNFICEVINGGLEMIGIGMSLKGLNWAIPVGISFFTFQSVGYLLDVYYKKIEAERNFFEYALFVSFFPSILSGPINKASLVLPQIKAQRPYFDYDKAVNGLKYLLWGMFMKVVVADRVGLYVDTVYGAYQNYSGITYAVTSILYSIQIYADFAGYSLMALGTGKLIGFELTENFRRPYFAFSVTDFWRRWHMSLSTWLKDYIYIPMGGNRCGKIHNYWNIFVTFLVSGIWHGANWTFIVWGICHGIFQIVEKILGEQKCKYGSFGRGVKIIITFILIDLAWIFFRMPSLDDAVCVIKSIITLDGGLNIYIAGVRDTFFMGIGLCLLTAKDIRDEFFPNRFLLMNNEHKIVRWTSYFFVLLVIMLSGVFDAGQFIYANF